MKVCPKCNEETGARTHVCPKCGYSYLTTDPASIAITAQVRHGRRVLLGRLQTGGEFYQPDLHCTGRVVNTNDCQVTVDVMRRGADKVTHEFWAPGTEVVPL